MCGTLSAFEVILLHCNHFLLDFVPELLETFHSMCPFGLKIALYLGELEALRELKALPRQAIKHTFRFSGMYSSILYFSEL